MKKNYQDGRLTNTNERMKGKNPSVWSKPGHTNANINSSKLPSITENNHTRNLDVQESMLSNKEEAETNGNGRH